MIFFVCDFFVLFLPFMVQEGNGRSFHYNRNRKAGLAVHRSNCRVCYGGRAAGSRALGASQVGEGSSRCLPEIATWAGGSRQVLTCFCLF